MAALRARITAGELLPGSRMPSRAVLVREFASTPTTVQAAINRLIAERLVVTQPRVGTFVSADATSLRTYGVVFAGFPLNQPPDNTFLSMLASTCAAQQALGARLTLYFGVTGHADEPDYQRLRDDLRAHRLAGVIFTDFTTQWLTQALWALFPAPGVAFTSFESAFPVLHTDDAVFFTRAVEYLHGRDCRRLAVISSRADATIAGFVPLLASYNMELPPHARLCHLTVASQADFFDPVRKYAYLLARDPALRPDAMILWDDSYLDYALDGLTMAGLRPGDDIEIVAHCNFPLARPTAWPIQRLGYPVPHFLTRAIELLDRQRDGDDCPPASFIDPLFEEEYLRQVERTSLTRATQRRQSPPRVPAPPAGAR